MKVTISGENGEDEVIDVPIWNGTVANIVLMSLGGRANLSPDFCTLIGRDPSRYCALIG